MSKLSSYIGERLMGNGALYMEDEEISKREKYLIRIGLVFGLLIGIAIGILLMYSLHLVGWY